MILYYNPASSSSKFPTPPPPRTRPGAARAPKPSVMRRDNLEYFADHNVPSSHVDSEEAVYLGSSDVDTGIAQSGK